MPIAYSYVRFSTAEQSKGDSLRRQLERRQKFLESRPDLTLDETLTLHDLGISAFKGANADEGALGKFIDAIDEGRVPRGSYLLVESLDRLSRASVDVALELFLSIIRKGITIATLLDAREYSTASIKNNFTEIIVSIAVMARAHEESATKSVRVSEAWAIKREKAKTTGRVMTRNTPFWLKAKDDWSGFEVIDEQAALVKRIFEMSAAGIGVQVIAQTLNKEGLRTGNGTLWVAGNIGKLLRSRRVIGEAVFSTFMIIDGQRIPTDPIPNYFPPIITEKLFFEVRDRFQGMNIANSGGKKAEYRNLFRRLLKCAYCGHSMSLQAGKYNSKKKGMLYQASLFCTGRRQGLDCPAKHWDYYDFQNRFLEFVKELDVTTLIGASAKTKEIESLQEQFAKERANKERKRPANSG